MKEGDFVRVDYTGRIAESGEVFDTTKEEIAKEGGVHKANFKYESVPIIVGAHLAIKGLEDALKGMKVGEEKKISVKPKDAFGKRSEKLIRLMSLTSFKDRNVTPHPGMTVTVNNLAGRVMSISGGRVKVDFNHPLAGKNLEYEIKVIKRITKKVERIKAVFELFLKRKDVDVKIKKGVVKINLGEIDAPKKVKNAIAEIAKKWVKGIEKMRFIDEY